MSSGELKHDSGHAETSSEMVPAKWTVAVATFTLTAFVTPTNSLDVIFKVGAVVYLAYSTYRELVGSAGAAAAPGPVRTRMLVYWTVLGTYLLAESILDCFLRGLPMYTLLKVQLLVWLVAPEPVNGSSYVYRRIISPLAKKTVDSLRENPNMTSWNALNTALQKLAGLLQHGISVTSGHLTTELTSFEEARKSCWDALNGTVRKFSALVQRGFTETAGHLTTKVKSVRDAWKPRPETTESDTNRYNLKSLVGVAEKGLVVFLPFKQFLMLLKAYSAAFVLYFRRAMQENMISCLHEECKALFVNKADCREHMHKHHGVKIE